MEGYTHQVVNGRSQWRHEGKIVAAKNVPEHVLKAAKKAEKPQHPWYPMTAGNVGKHHVPTSAIGGKKAGDNFKMEEMATFGRTPYGASSPKKSASPKKSPPKGTVRGLTNLQKDTRTNVQKEIDMRRYKADVFQHLKSIEVVANQLRTGKPNPTLDHLLHLINEARIATM